MTTMQIFFATCILAFIPFIFNAIEAFKAKETSVFRVVSILCNGAIGVASLILFVVGLN